MLLTGGVVRQVSQEVEAARLKALELKAELDRAMVRWCHCSQFGKHVVTHGGYRRRSTNDD